MKKAQNAEELKLRSSFESIVAILSQDRFQERLSYPLAFWTLPSDRRLPLSLLDYPLRRVLTSQFHELASTPGIGQKKLHSLILLLERAVGDAPPMIPIRIHEEFTDQPTEKRFRPVDVHGNFDPALVSEALWQQWRETVELHGVDDEKLGRLATSLIELPTVIWDTPLSAYVSQSLQQIRQLRTHGEKRVRVVLEVFFVVHEMLHKAGRHSRMTIRLAPSFVPPLEKWFDSALSLKSVLTIADLRENLALPLIEQLEQDVSSDVVKLAKGRLGIDAPPVAVRHQSREFGVTRARIYQLLEECERVMSVRWPEGRRLFCELQAHFERESPCREVAEFFYGIRELFFPRKYEQVQAMLRQA
jgi:hypothetical protein